MLTSTPGQNGPSHWQHLPAAYNDTGGEPEASIIIPVNAQADLQKVMLVVEQLGHYGGSHCLELILVINNYLPHSPPPEIDILRQMGVCVVAAPSARREGEVVILTARALGVEAARSEVTIHFDADTQIVNSTALIDWYIDKLTSGIDLAYTHVGYYELRQKLPVRIRVAVHHFTRWVKRTFMGVPTTRGGNYAITRSAWKRCYEAGQLSVDMQVGPAVKLNGGRTAYSARRNLHVLTSGRKHTGRWRTLFPYFFHRLRYNFKAIPTRRRPVQRGSWEGFDLETERRLRATPAAAAAPNTILTEGSQESQRPKE